MPITIPPLTPDEITFINDNYQSMSRPKIAAELKICKYRVDKYMTEADLTKVIKRHPAKVVVMPGMYDEREFNRVMGFDGHW